MFAMDVPLLNVVGLKSIVRFASYFPCLGSELYT